MSISLLSTVPVFLLLVSSSAAGLTEITSGKEFESKLLQKSSKPALVFVYGLIPKCPDTSEKPCEKAEKMVEEVAKAYQNVAVYKARDMIADFESPGGHHFSNIPALMKVKNGKAVPVDKPIKDKKQIESYFMELAGEITK